MEETSHYVKGSFIYSTHGKHIYELLTFTKLYLYSPDLTWL